MPVALASARCVREEQAGEIRWEETRKRKRQACLKAVERTGEPRSYKMGGAEGHMTSAVLGDPRPSGLGKIRHMWHMGVRRKGTLWHSVDVVLGGVRSCSARIWRDLGPDSPGKAAVGMGCRETSRTWPQ